MDFNQRAKRIVDMSVGLIPKEEPPAPKDVEPSVTSKRSRKSPCKQSA